MPGFSPGSGGLDTWVPSLQRGRGLGYLLGQAVNPQGSEQSVGVAKALGFALSSQAECWNLKRGEGATPPILGLPPLPSHLLPPPFAAAQKAREEFEEAERSLKEMEESIR